MNDPATHTEQCSAGQACACEACAALPAHTAWQVAVLKELTELGLRMARALCEETEAAPREEVPDRRNADPLARLSRSVRQTLALQARLIEGGQIAPAQRAGQAATRKAEAVGDYEIQRAAAIARKETVFEVVEATIDFDAPEDQVEHLLERLEDLRDPADDAKFADAPLTVWITAICKDLGLTPHWPLWAGEDWAALEAVTWPESPFAKLYPPDPRPSPPAGGETQGAEAPHRPSG